LLLHDQFWGDALGEFLGLTNVDSPPQQEGPSAATVNSSLDSNSPSARKAPVLASSAGSEGDDDSLNVEKSKDSIVLREDETQPTPVRPVSEQQKQKHEQQDNDMFAL